MSSEKERKKRLTDKQQAILDIVVTAIEALVVVFCIVVSVVVWVGASDPTDRNINWFAIQTDSMMGSNPDSLNPGDMMFAKKVKSIADLKVGDVIAFKGSVVDSAGNVLEDQIITHRIIAINAGDNRIYTQGDNAANADTFSKMFEDVIGVYTGKAKGLGKLTLWLGGYKKVVTNEAKYNDPNQLGGYGYERSGSTATFLVIIIPLALLFIYNGYVVVKWTMDERAKKIRAAAMAEAEQKQSEQSQDAKAMAMAMLRAAGMSEQQIADYFAQQEGKKDALEASPVDESVSPVEESPDDSADGSDDSAE